MNPAKGWPISSRSANVDIIRYRSVRDPRHGFNLALLTCRVFTKPKPVREQTWRIRLSEAGAQAICEVPRSGITFGRDAFAADPRIARLRWKRASVSTLPLIANSAKVRAQRNKCWGPNMIFNRRRFVGACRRRPCRARPAARPRRRARRPAARHRQDHHRLSARRHVRHALPPRRREPARQHLHQERAGREQGGRGRPDRGAGHEGRADRRQRHPADAGLDADDLSAHLQEARPTMRSPTSPP